MTTTRTTPRPPALFPTPAGILAVSLGEDEHDGPVILLECPDDAHPTLTPERARRLAGELRHLANMTEPLNTEAFRGLLKALGITLEEAAAEAGVELATATMADEWPIVKALGERLARGDDEQKAAQA